MQRRATVTSHGNRHVIGCEARQYSLLKCEYVRHIQVLFYTSLSK